MHKLALMCVKIGALPSVMILLCEFDDVHICEYGNDYAELLSLKMKPNGNVCRKCCVRLNQMSFDIRCFWKIIYFDLDFCEFQL